MVVGQRSDRKNIHFFNSNTTLHRPYTTTIENSTIEVNLHKNRLWFDSRGYFFEQPRFLLVQCERVVG